MHVWYLSSHAGHATASPATHPARVQAHERSLNTDVLFALLKRMICRRRELQLQSCGGASAHDRIGPDRLVIASATLDANRMSKFFFDAPVIHIGAMKYPIRLLHAARPSPAHALVEAALELVLRIHVERADSPHDDILVFFTGQDEITTATHALRELVTEVQASSSRPQLDLLALPIHASLPSEEQARVFAPAPAGVRKVILATNVAETSLTLPGVRVVIDLGMVKEKNFDRDKGIEVLSVVAISQSSARQRAGRAGRSAPGDVYRLYTEAQFTQMSAEQVPLLCCTPLSCVSAFVRSCSRALVLSCDAKAG